MRKAQQVNNLDGWETRGLFVIELLGNWYIIREISWHNILGYVLWLRSTTPFSLSCFYSGGYMKSREWLSSGQRLPFFTFYNTARLLLFSFFFALSSLDKQLLLFLSLSLARHPWLQCIWTQHKITLILFDLRRSKNVIINVCSYYTLHHIIDLLLLFLALFFLTHQLKIKEWSNWKDHINLIKRQEQ